MKYKMYPVPLQRVLSGGRITLPTKFREKYGIKEGNYVDVSISDGVLIVAVDVTVKKKGEK